MLAIKYGFSFIVISLECDTRHNHFDSARQWGLRTRMKIDQLFFFFFIIVIIIIIIIIIILFFAHAQCVSPLCFRGVFPVV